MTDHPSTPATPAGDVLFGDVLRRLRIAAGLSQEALAERSGLSARAISDLERGARRAPYRDSVRMLADALALAPADRAALTAAAPRHRPPPGATPPEPSRAASGPVSAAAGNLPIPLTSFVGRQQELAEVRRLLGRTRLLTLTGAGGCGKTRLALEVARTLRQEQDAAAGSGSGLRYPDGVWLVELAALSDPLLVPDAVAIVLGVRAPSGQPPAEALADHLRDQRVLLVLDNCEHLVDASAALAELVLRACPMVQVLATSREVLRIDGETAWRVPSLGLPPVEDTEQGEDEPLTAAALAGYAAVQLFTARAEAAQAGFALTDENAPAVLDICRRLDGIPLALELAAARVRSLSVEQIAARLDDAFRLLAGGSRTAAGRHQTLRACIDWSHDLLAEPERVCFVRLGVFAGGFVLDAAETVCGDDGLDRREVLTLVTALVDKSLVQADQRGEAVRYRLLETIRQYAAEKLEPASESAAVRDRHQAWCIELADTAAPRLEGAEQGAWLARLEQEHENLRAALRRIVADGQRREDGVRLAGALARFWRVHGHAAEGRDWLEQVLCDGCAFDHTLCVRALNGAGVLALEQGAHEQAQRYFEQCLALYRAVA